MERIETSIYNLIYETSTTAKRFRRKRAASQLSNNPPLNKKSKKIATIKKLQQPLQTVGDKAKETNVMETSKTKEKAKIRKIRQR